MDEVIGRGTININLDDSDARSQVDTLVQDIRRKVESLRTVKADVDIGAKTAELDKALVKADAAISKFERDDIEKKIKLDESVIDRQLAAINLKIKNAEIGKALAGDDKQFQKNIASLLKELDIQKKKAEAVKQTIQVREQEKRAAGKLLEDELKSEQAHIDVINNRIRAQEKSREIKTLEAREDARRAVEVAKLEEGYARAITERERLVHKKGDLDVVAKLRTAKYDAEATLFRQELKAKGHELDLDVKVKLDRSSLGPLDKLKEILTGHFGGFLKEIAKQDLIPGRWKFQVAQLNAGLLALIPIATSLVGAFGSLVGVAGAGAAGAAAIGGGIFAGLATNLIGVGSAVKRVSAQFTEADKAQTKYEEAVAKFGPASVHAIEANEQLQSVLKQMDPALKNAFEGFKKVSEQWEALVVPTASKDIGQILGGGIKTLNVLMPELAKNSNETFGIITKHINDIFAQLRQPREAKAFEQLGRSANQFLSPALSGLQRLGFGVLHIFESAARQFAGPVGKAIKEFGEDFSKATIPGKKLDETIKHLGEDAHAVGRFFVALGKVIFDVFGAGVSTGKEFTESMTGGLERWDKFLKSTQGKNELHKFFKTAVEDTEKLWRILGPIAGLLFGSAAELQSGFLKTLLSIGEAAVEAWKGLGKLVGLNKPLEVLGGTLAALFVVNKAFLFAAAIGNVAKAAAKAAEALKNMAAGQAAVDATSAGGGIPIIGKAGKGVPKAAEKGGISIGGAAVGAGSTAAGIGVAEAAPAAGGALAGAAGSAGGAAAAAGPFVIPVVLAIGAVVGLSQLNVVKRAISGISKDVEELVGSFSKPLHDLGQAFGRLFGSLAEAFKKAGGTKDLRLIANAFEGLWSVIHPLATLIEHAFDGLANKGGVLQRALKNEFRAIGETMRSPIEILTGVVNIIAGILGGRWSLVWEGAKKVVQGAVHGILGILKTFNTPFIAAWEALGAPAVKAIKNVLGKVIGAVGSFADDLFNAAWNLGQKVAKGLLSGIISIPDKIKKGVEDLANKYVIDPFEKILGTHSPSKVTERLGRNVSEGLINGIKGISIKGPLERYFGSALGAAANAVRKGIHQINVALYNELKQLNPGGKIPTLKEGGPPLAPGVEEVAEAEAKHGARGGIMQIGKPGASGVDNRHVHVVVGDGEQVAVFTKQQQAIANAGLAPIGGLPGVFRNDQPHHMAKGGFAGWKNVVASAESLGGLGYQSNPIQARGYSELSVPPSVANAGSALGHLPYRTPMRIRAGKREVVAAKQDIGAGSSFNPVMGLYPQTVADLGLSGGEFHVSIERADGQPLTGGAIAGVAAALKAKHIKTPAWHGPGGILGSIGKTVVKLAVRAANKRLDAATPAPQGGGAGAVGAVGPAGGPAGLGTFDGHPVALWIIPELEYARKHGWKGHITSGYRSPFQVISGSIVAPQGHSEHQGTQYPHGAVDFGGPSDGANAEEFRRATAGYKGKRLLSPIGFIDLGHMSGTGHARGGFAGGRYNQPALLVGEHEHEYVINPKRPDNAEHLKHAGEEMGYRVTPAAGGKGHKKAPVAVKGLGRNHLYELSLAAPAAFSSGGVPEAKINELVSVLHKEYEREKTKLKTLRTQEGKDKHTVAEDRKQKGIRTGEAQKKAANAIANAKAGGEESIAGARASVQAAESAPKGDGYKARLSHAHAVKGAKDRLSKAESKAHRSIKNAETKAKEGLSKTQRLATEKLTRDEVALKEVIRGIRTIDSTGGGQFENERWPGFKKVTKDLKKAEDEKHKVEEWNAKIAQLNDRISEQRTQMDIFSKRFDRDKRVGNLSGMESELGKWRGEGASRGRNIGQLNKYLKEARTAAGVVGKLTQGDRAFAELEKKLTTEINQGEIAEVESEAEAGPELPKTPQQEKEQAQAEKDARGEAPSAEDFVFKQGRERELQGYERAAAEVSARIVPDNPNTPVNEELPSLIEEREVAKPLASFWEQELQAAINLHEPDTTITQIAQSTASARSTYQGFQKNVEDAEKNFTSQTLAEANEFSKARLDLYKNFGSNFQPIWTKNPTFSGPGAGLQTAPGVGGGAGTSPSGGGGGGTVVHVTNHFSEPPANSHHWSQGIAWELKAAI